MNSAHSRLQIVFPLLCLLMGCRSICAGDSNPITRTQEFLANYCFDCHSEENAEGGLDFQAASLRGDIDTRVWEAAIKRMQGRQMPPADTIRPSESQYDAAVDDLDHILTEYAVTKAKIVDVPTIRRLTRTQYQHAIRDLLGIEVDVSRWLPEDSLSHGFDNLAVEDLSPLLMNRYLRAAADISRLAIGRSVHSAEGVTIRVPPDRTQSGHVDGLPLGTRGGVWFDHFFPRDGTYDFQVRLSRDRDEKVEGLSRAHDLDVLIDGDPRHRFRVLPPKNPRDQESVDRDLRVRLDTSAGMHRVGVTFASQGTPIVETKRQPFDARYNRHRHPRLQPAVYEVSVVGPVSDPSESKVPSKVVDGVPKLRLTPGSVTDADNAAKFAKTRLRSLMQIAYRRPVDADDFLVPMKFFADAFRRAIAQKQNPNDAYQAGGESALASVLVNPNFLFRIERSGRDESPSKATRVDDLTLASRLSFFLWNSLPDDRLLELAAENRLHVADTLSDQVERMLRDPRSNILVDDFASQWLYLSNLKTAAPDLREFPDFDDNLRQAFVDETRHLVRWVFREDLSVLDLLRPDRMFLNDRLATHYGIAGVAGSHFRTVPITCDSELRSQRGGLLRNGSILMVTSYATRTSPTLRGNWILENLLGTPTPPPPANVPALKEKSTLVASTVRERLEKHRADPACASCHDRIDPLGFALENYDAVGRWRDRDNDQWIDSNGIFPDGQTLKNVADLESALLERPEMFAIALTEKLMTFALGRGIEHDDGPTIRQIVRGSRKTGYRFSSLIQGIVASPTFQMRGNNQ